VTDELGRMDDAALGSALASLAPRVFPETPDLAAAVSERVAVTDVPRRRFRVRALVAVAAALALIMALPLVVSPDLRRAVADALGIGGVRIETDDHPLPVPLGAELQLGEQVTLEEARRRAPFRVLVPHLAGLHVPDEVYVGMPPAGVALLYKAGPGLPPARGSRVGLLVMQFPASHEDELITKGVGPRSEVFFVEVRGRTGYWIQGEAHTVVYRDTEGRERSDTARLAGNVLVFEGNGITYRIESGLPRAEVIRIAESLR
jgi:hypothetical protein